MGVMRSIGFNTAMARQNRATRSAANSTLEAVPAASLRSGDCLYPEGYGGSYVGSEPWTVKSVEATGKRVPGLGLLCFGSANSCSIRIVLNSDTAGPNVIELSELKLVLREQRS